MKIFNNKTKKSNNQRGEIGVVGIKQLIAFSLMLSLGTTTFTGIFLDNVYAEGEEAVATETIAPAPEPTPQPEVVVEPTPSSAPETEPATDQVAQEDVLVPVDDVEASVDTTPGVTEVSLDPVYSTSDIQPTGSSDLLESTIDPADVVSEEASGVPEVENTGDGSGGSSNDTEPVVEETGSSTIGDLLEDEGQVKGTSTTDLESELEKKEVEEGEVEEVSTDIEVENYTDYDAKTKKRPTVKIRRSSLSPSKEFKITLTGRRISRKVTTMSGASDGLGLNSQSGKNKNGKGDINTLYTVSEAEIKLVNSEPDTETGEVFTQAISVSGACSQKYYVILLYKNLSDYEENPSSYILNKAFECTTGTYSYNIDSLPKSLEKGPYYLLVGQQDDGPWTPLSSINEIVID